MPRARRKTTPATIDPESMREHAADASRLLKALANEKRLMLLCRLGEGEASAGDLAEYAGLAQSAASQHLAKLRDVGVVATRRDAQTIYYRLADEGALRVIGLLCDIYRRPRAAGGRDG